jgi:thioredoxin 2
MSENIEDKVTLRCPFCLTLNKVDLDRAADRPACGDCAKPMLLDRPVKVMAEDFDRTVLGSSAPVLVDFYADWCGPCKIVAPMVDEIAGAHTGELLVAKVDSDRAQDIVQRLGIRGVPTLILFKGGEEMARSVGFEPEKIREMVEQAVGTVASSE